MTIFGHPILMYGPAWLALAVAIVLIAALIAYLRRPLPRPYDWERDGL